MAVTIKGFGSDWSVPTPARASLDALYTTKAVGITTTDVSNSAFAVSGTRVAVGGDSITDGAGSSNTAVYSYYARLQKILGSARANVVEHGGPGESAAGLLARMPAIVAENPGAFVLMIGMNPSSSLTAYKSEVTQILDHTRNARIPTLIALVTPRRELAEHRERINTYNMFLRHIASQRSLPVVDTYTPLVDPATGYAKPALMTDAAHPNDDGHLIVAKTIAPALKLILPPALPIATAVGAPGLVANPVMAVDANGWSMSASVITGATHTTEVAAPVPGDGLTSGNWLKMAVDATAAAGTANFLRHHDLSATPAAGDKLLITAQVKTSEERPGAVSVQFMNGSSIVATIADNFGVSNPGIIQHVLTAPTFTGTPRIRFSVSALAGATATGYIGAVQVYNLTQMGLTELAG